MAGQPPEPSFQPAGQDQALTQGRPAWGQPTYTPPTGNPGGQQENAAAGYGYEQQAGQGYAPPSYTPPEPGYTPQEQTYAGQDQAYASPGQAAGQDYQAYQPPGYGQQPGQAQPAGAGIPQWQGAGASAARPRQAGEKGFIGSLFDFSFTSLVTPKVIKVLYVLFTIWTALVGLIFLIVAFKYGGMAGGLFTLIICEPIYVLLSLGISRVVLEAFMVVFRIYDETKQIRENGESRA